MATGMEIVAAERSCQSLGDLPEYCIASILSLTTPRDVARLACVNSIFREASSSDLVWQRMLPPSYLDILAQALDVSATTRSKKEIYDFLSNRVVLENGTQDFWLDRASGGVCRSIGARGLFIMWGDDQRYWSWTKRDGSRFDEVAYLERVCWLEIQGNIQCSLPSGSYTLSWRLSFSFGMDNFRGFKDSPVKFSFESTDNEPVQFENVFTSYSRIPSTSKGRLRPLWRRGYGEMKWMEIDVGKFTVETENSPADLKFSMMNTASFWKSGMYLDSVVIRPTSVEQRKS